MPTIKVKGSPIRAGVKRLRRSLLRCMMCFHLLAPSREVIDSAACAHPASAGPENVQCRSAFIQFKRALVRQPRSPGAGVQPVFDSRHGRIACKTSLPAVPLRCKVTECGRLQSVPRAQSQPLSLADGRAPKFKFSFRSRWLPKHPLGIVIGSLGH